MAKLTTAQRKRLKASQFAGPGRSYPIMDREHAGMAKGRATQQYEAGNLTKAQKDKIFARANKMEAKTGGIPGRKGKK